jgi:hypothetical protein
LLASVSDDLNIPSPLLSYSVQLSVHIVDKSVSWILDNSVDRVAASAEGWQEKETSLLLLSTMTS